MELREDKCRTCQAPIIWVTSKNGKAMPLDAKPEKRVVISHDPAGGPTVGLIRDTYLNHYATCPQAQRWRGRKRPSAPGT